MIELVSSLILIAIILWLFAQDRHRDGEISKVLWIPIIWIFIAGSRPVSLWFHIQVIGTGADDQLEGSPVDRNILAILILSALIVLIKRRRKVAALLRTNGPIIVFLLYCGLSILWSDFPNSALKRWIRIVGDFSMVLVILTDTCASAAIKAIFARLGFLILPLSILFDIGRGFSGRGWHFGLTMNKNMFGMISMILGLGAVWRCSTMRGGVGVKHRKSLAIYGSLVVMAMWCLWMADSTTSTACFLIGSILIIFRRWLFAQKRVVIHLFVALLIFLPLYVIIINPDVGIISDMGKDPTLTGRTEVWQTVLGMSPSSWFGAGIESFWLGSRLKTLWSIFPWAPNEAHNGYIETYLNLGWIGIILLSIIMVTGYRKILSGIPHEREISSLRLMFFVVAAVYNLTEAGFRMFSAVWITFLLAIIADNAINREYMEFQTTTRTTSGFSKSHTLAEADSGNWTGK